MALTTEVRVKILPDFTVYDREVKKRTSISVTNSKGTSESSGVGTVAGAAALGGGIGAVIGSTFSKALSSGLDQIEKLLQQSVFYQKSMEALQKLISVGIRFLGDIVGGIVLTVFKLLLPLVKVLNLLWAPFQKQMLLGIKTAFEKNKEPLDALIDSSMVIANTVSSFFGVINNTLATTVVKSFVSAITELGQILVISLAGGFISIVNAIFGLAITLSNLLGQKQLAQGLEQTRSGIVDQVGTGAAALVGGLEALKETFNITADQYLSNYIESLYKQNEASIAAATATSDFSSLLSNLASAFDPGFGQKISDVLTAVQEKADEFRETLANNETATFSAGEALSQMSQTIAQTLTPEVDGATQSTMGWDKILNPLITNLFNASNNTGLLNSAVGLLTIASSPAEQAVIALNKVIDNLGTAAREAMTAIENALNKIKSKVSIKIPENYQSAIDTFSNLANPGTNTGYVAGVISKELSRKTNSGNFFNDFIMRPGSAPTNFSANDTIIGVKDPSSLGGGKGVVINNYISGIGDRQLEDLILRTVEKSMRTSYTAGYGAQLR